MLVKTYDGNDLKNEFRDWNRDYYTLDACEQIIQLFEETSNEPQELDIIGLCGGFNEDTMQDVLNNYGYMLELGDDWDELDEDEQLDRLTDLLNEHTWAVRTQGYNDEMEWNEYILYLAF